MSLMKERPCRKLHEAQSVFPVRADLPFLMSETKVSQKLSTSNFLHNPSNSSSCTTPLCLPEAADRHPLSAQVSR